jgi:carboxy-terminal domain RNA polymerase II polypeptide A small phosphatase
MPDLLVILDLDETLIHASPSIASTAADFQSGRHGCIIRPYAQQLIGSLLQEFEVAVWTSAGESHAEAVVDALFESRSDLVFVWSARRCTEYRDYENNRVISLKNLHKLRRHGHDLSRVVAIDDSPEKYLRNYGNLIRVDPWEGDPSDVQLADLAQYVRWLGSHDDVRRVEKRGWSRQMSWRAPT